MTIAAAYLTSEGVVLGADSATTVSVRQPTGGAGVAQVFRYAQKVFEVGDPGRAGLCAYGAGSIAEVSHRTLVACLADEMKQNNLTISAATDRLVELVSQARRGAAGPLPDVGYFVGGWDAGTHAPSCFQLNIPANGAPDKTTLTIGDARFAGMPQVFTRVFYGVDGQLEPRLREILKTRLGHAVPPDFDAVFSSAFEEAAAPLVAIGYRDLPLREAIDFVHAYLHITVKAVKFKFGPPVCGGPIEIGFISTDRTFRWACHKTFDVAIEEV
jgi:hypothetical protein